jgi:hypothetical protein
MHADSFFRANSTPGGVCDSITLRRGRDARSNMAWAPQRRLFARCSCLSSTYLSTSQFVTHLATMLMLVHCRFRMAAILAAIRDR